ncbi:hypothetical protein [Deinococcus soli (ex Cha et al. 2016)]|uniref:Uncharacterized protein n=2 Tax=Deinococcus soli (ex Cha et al. 2016) TaxID=1309411 RepID=A0ACC6KL33_9DEIO|nr:hypothetical protein [Deinococcus soli (ex Cha et al. 2016)]MDR6218724.1 hypothetical protein [Deinococcus soli (ex Cha et al. 2016)]MDR6328521.1 hypothetical protein [Deinococcus soli (ex Cha et al. 2016)]MDR6753132.1 hypothetical protein [Deinococcus soli (ex Cha et al. 2016)]
MKRIPLTAALLTALTLTLSFSGVADASRRSSSTSSRSSISVSRAATPRPTARPVSQPRTPAPARVSSGGSFGGAARSSPATPTARSARPGTTLKKIPTAPKVKPSDCDADDLIEGDVEDCGAAALPGAVATAAVSTSVAATRPSVTRPRPAPMPVASSQRSPTWAVWTALSVTLLLLAVGYVVTRR